jgi:hypothetical protein
MSALQQLIELNKTIVSLRTNVSYLERELQNRDKIPIPPLIVEQIMNLSAENSKLRSDLKYYKSFVQPQVIINRESTLKPPSRKGGIPK